MNDGIKEILNKWKCYIELTKKFTTNEYEMLRVEDIDKILDYITNLQEENERLKDIRNLAIDYNKTLCKLYDCGTELSNAETNLCILEDEETINILQGKSDE